jgi:NAD(P)-dependent dehydrogenase (short-subunit alcohol dehydrogenase family)
VARRGESLEELAASREMVVPWIGDLTQPGTPHRLVDHVIAEHGRIDVLVNCAGASNIAKAVDETTEEFRTVLELNLIAPFELCRLAGKQMMSQPAGGSIINIASIVGLVGLGRMPQAGYAASKAALVNLTRELAAQWARKGVRVNAIAPGWFRTEMTAELFGTQRGRDWVADLTPMAREGELDELDGALLLLAGRASTYMTGVVIPVDGGWTAV